MNPISTHPISEAAAVTQDQAAWRAIFRTNACLSKALDHRLERRHGLSLSSLEALSCLADADGQRMRMCDLAAGAALSRSGLTRLADRLEAGGLIIRDRCCDDARGAFAKLTDGGRDLVEQARATQREAVDELLLSHLTAAERKMIAAALERALATGLADCGCSR